MKVYVDESSEDGSAPEQDDDSDSDSDSSSSSTSKSNNSNASAADENVKEKIKRKPKSKYWRDSYPCLFCPCIFMDWRGLRRHMIEYRTSDENPEQASSTPLPPPRKESNSEGIGDPAADNAEDPENDGDGADVNPQDHQDLAASEETNSKEKEIPTPINAPEVKGPTNEEIPPTAPSSSKPEPKFKCPLCDSGFTKLTRYNTHILSSHPPNSAQHNRNNCRICHKSFKTLRYLEKHMETKHRRFGVKSFLCSTCGASFLTQRYLDQHIQRTHTSVTQHMCSICDRPCWSAPHLQKHLKTHEAPQAQKVHLCAICGFSTSTEQNLRKHMFVHTDARPHKCSQCPSTFKRNRDLKKHVGVHSELRHQCPDCDKIYKKKDRLTQHRKTNHLGLSKSHACAICGAAYELAILLNGHMKRVHGEPKHECEVCSKKFKTGQQLKSHAVVHDRSEEAKRLSCQICGKKFKLKSHLNQHSTCHLSEAEKKHVCGFCGKRFGIPWHLRQHEAAHHSNSKSKTTNMRCTTCN